MRLQDIVETVNAKKSSSSNINEAQLARYLRNSEKYHSFISKSVLGYTILDDSVDVNSMLKDYYANQASGYDTVKERETREKENKHRAVAAMLISSGFNFEGYRIVKYSGYISGDAAIQVSRGRDGIFANPTNVGTSLMSSLTKARQSALAELKDAAYALGCNAVIGVDFDYITLDPQTANFTGGTTYLPYVFGVTANGNAVIIEKIEDDEDA